MRYSEVIHFLFNQLANYQKVGTSAYKPGLHNISNFLSKIGNPHKSLKTIHIAGTNGKGSTSHILASILIENGYKVGLFTSPHIKDFRERIKINGELINKQTVVDFVSTNKQTIDNLNPSFFEITTAMAFSIFKSKGCDISIIETGLGGRLDSTNIINPEVSIITNIGIDHTNFLGTTLKQIAAEKAGIIKQNTPVIIGEFNDETYPVFEAKAKECDSKLVLSNNIKNIKTDLLGQFQQLNIATALTTIDVINTNGWYIDDAKTRLALTRIKRNTQFNARLDQISKYPRIIVDASHNVDGVNNLFKELDLMKYNNLHCIYGTSSDKNVAEIMKIFPKSATYYLTSFDSERAMDIIELKNNASNNNLNFTTYQTTIEALSSAKQNYKDNDIIVVFGSFFLLEKII